VAQKSLDTTGMLSVEGQVIFVPLSLK